MRMYIQPSWTDAAEDHDLWSGGNGQYRGDPSINLTTFDAKGRARMEAFSDAAVEALKEKRKTSISIRDRILPQLKRVNLLTDQLIELEAEYKSGKMSIDEYSVLRNVLSVKRTRAEVLYKKAVSVKPAQTDEPDLQERQEFSSENYEYTVEKAGISDYKSGDIPQWLLNTKPSNCFRNPLIKALQVLKKAVEFKHKTSNYINTLKAL